MTQFADLHIHTHFSDGSDRADEVLAHARENHVAFLSVTDHNTVRAYSEDGLRQADETGVRLIPGVELDVIHENRQYHLLAYGVDVHNQALGEACAHNTRVQEESNLSLLRCMERDGLGVSERDYHSYAIPQGRGGWKLLNYLLDTGLTGSLLEGTKYYKQYAVDSNKIKFVSLTEAVHMVKDASGVPVLAHPAEQIPYNPYEAEHGAFWQTLNGLLAAGIEGIECFHPLHGFGLQRELVSLCRERGLFCSGGTDYHGSFFNKQKQVVGGQMIFSHMVRELLDRCLG